MQITVDIPAPLAAKLSALPDPPGFILDLLTEALEGGLDEDQWWQLLREIETVAVDTGVSDLAERHDHSLGMLVGTERVYASVLETTAWSTRSTTTGCLCW
jgi:hypothetical protein